MLRFKNAAANKCKQPEIVITAWHLLSFQNICRVLSFQTFIKIRCEAWGLKSVWRAEGTKQQINQYSSHSVRKSRFLAFEVLQVYFLPPLMALKSPRVSWSVGLMFGHYANEHIKKLDLVRATMPARCDLHLNLQGCSETVAFYCTACSKRPTAVEWPLINTV